MCASKTAPNHVLILLWLDLLVNNRRVPNFFVCNLNIVLIILILYGLDSLLHIVKAHGLTALR